MAVQLGESWDVVVGKTVRGQLQEIYKPGRGKGAPLQLAGYQAIRKDGTQQQFSNIEDAFIYVEAR